MRNKQPRHAQAASLDALEQLRLRRDWTYRELAGFLGIRMSTIHAAIQRGSANARTLAKVQRLLDGHKATAA